MLLSERELELSDEHSGIIELDPKAKIGSSAAAALGLDDAVIEVAITPNRPDCLGVRGIARDLAAAELGALKKDTVKPIRGGFPNPIPIELEFDKQSADACPVFAGRLVRGVKNGPSPDWLQRRLKAIGLRPINTLVDITNYIAYDRGRPLHVYDADKLTGAVRARLGRKGERFVALDGKNYDVDDDMCVIADDRAVLGLGGVTGGEETGVTDATTNVFIELAYFDPKRTARTGRKLGIISDARFRFERGVDPDFVVPGLELATEMVLELCGGEPSKITIAGKPPKANKPFKFDLGLVERLSGLELEHRHIKRLLAALGISLDGKGKQVKATPPPWRPDITGPADLVEEVVRLTGVDKVPATPMPREAGVAKPVLTEATKTSKVDAARARRARIGRGGDVVVHSAGRSKTVRRRAGRADLEQPDLHGASADAPVAAAGADHRRAAKSRQRLRRRRPVRAWASLSGRSSRGSAHERGRRSLRPLGTDRLGSILVRRSP